MEVVRSDNPLAPAHQVAPSEALVDEFLRALAPEPEPEPEPKILDLRFEDDTEPEAAPAPSEPIAQQPPRAAQPEPATPTSTAAPASKGRRPARNVQERIRGLTAPEQQKLARIGDQRDRVVLERMYGKNVWEGLLRNPKLTPPEAARIARMGALPLPLLEIIVNNRAWLSSPQVRRALLANPRLKKDMLMSVLRTTPRNELKLMPKQMAYPLAVRQAAQKMLK